jgi:hypothetical protein
MERSAIRTTVAVLVGALAITAALSTSVAQAEPVNWDSFMWPGGHQHYHCSIHHGEFCVYDDLSVDCAGDAGEVVGDGDTTSVDGVEVRCSGGYMCVEATGSCVSSPARQVPGGMGPSGFNTVPVADGVTASGGPAP